MKNLALYLCCFLAPLSVFCQNSVNRALPAFSKISVSGGYDKIILQEGSAESVQLDVNGIDPEKITTEVKGNTLYISTQRGNWRNMKAKITVSYRQITEIANSGSSDIEALSTIKADKFQIATSGSGNFNASFDVHDLDVAISGSSDMTLRGKADNQDIAISGSGDVDAASLTGASAAVAISGSGDVRLGVKGKVKTAVSGSGTVTNNK